MIPEVPHILSGYAFCRNPVEVRADGDASASTPCPYSVEVGGRTVFNGSYLPPFSVDLSDVAEGCTVPFPEVPESDSVFIPVVSQQGLSDYTMTVNLRPEAGADSSTRAGSISLTLVPGGVSYRNWRRLQELGMDPFTHRFLNPAANFFLTSRTGSWRIVVRETELYPLYFIMPDAGKVIIRERLSHKEYAMSLGKGVWALSITALRLHFLDQEHILASAFDVYRQSQDGKTYSCGIFVEEAPVAKDRLIVKFRNSLGIFEMADLPGEVDVSLSEDDGAEAGERFDKSVCRLVSFRGRVSQKKTYSVEMSPVSGSRWRLLAEIAASGDVWILRPREYPVKVIPSIDDLTFRLFPKAPQSFKMAFEAVDRDAEITPDIVTGDECRYKGMFSEEFSDAFD